MHKNGVIHNPITYKLCTSIMLHAQELWYRNPITCYRKSVLHTVAMEQVTSLGDHQQVGPMAEHLDAHLVKWPTVSGTGWVDTKPATLTDTDCTCRMNITMDSLSEWCVKDIKNCLFQAELNTFGLKQDLVDRLYNYMTTFQINSEPVTWAGPCRGPSRRRCRTSSAATYLQLQDKKPLIILYNLQGWIFIFQLWIWTIAIFRH